MERSLFEGKRTEEVIIAGHRFVATELGVKRAAQLINYLSDLLSFVLDRFKKETDESKPLTTFLLELLPEIAFKYTEQICLFISVSVKDEKEQYVTIEQVEEMRIPDTLQLATAVLVVNAEQITQTIELLQGDIKKKILKAYPILEKYLAEKTSKEVPETEPQKLTPESLTESSNGT
jgi:hypothetical protein